MSRKQQTLVEVENREQLCQREVGMRREQQTLVGEMNREQLCQRVQWMKKLADTCTMNEQRAALPESARDEETASKTITQKNLYSTQNFCGSR